ncbi:(2Fe-2S)-binding protein [Alphaproteobacteria bacterium]|nr:(2Fe-2S)-binding protein [Alphaproteobacteria bacterium]
MTAINLVVNEKPITADVEDTMLLGVFLRESLKLTGTHIGCDTSQCGACVIHLDGMAVKACTMLAVQADGAQLTTIEGLADGDNLHPVQQAFIDNHGLQCGYCTPGMIMAATNFLAHNLTTDIDEISKALEGNICRCTGYNNIIKSVQQAANMMKADLSADEAGNV